MRSLWASSGIHLDVGILQPGGPPGSVIQLVCSGTRPASFVKPFHGSYQLVEDSHHVDVVVELLVRKLDAELAEGTIKGSV